MQSCCHQGLPSLLAKRRDYCPSLRILMHLRPSRFTRPLWVWGRSGDLSPHLNFVSLQNVYMIRLSSARTQLEQPITFWHVQLVHIQHYVNSDFSNSPAFGPARSWAQCRGASFPGVNSIRRWRYSFVPSSRPTLLIILPSFSEVYRDVCRIYRRPVFLVATPASSLIISRGHLLM